MHGVVIRDPCIYFRIFYSLFLRSIDYRYNSGKIMLSGSKGCSAALLQENQNAFLAIMDTRFCPQISAYSSPTTPPRVFTM